MGLEDGEEIAHGRSTRSIGIGPEDDVLEARKRGPVSLGDRASAAGPGDGEVRESGAGRDHFVEYVGAFFTFNDNYGGVGVFLNQVQIVECSILRERLPTLPTILAAFEERDQILFAVTVVANDVADNHAGRVAVGVVSGVAFLVFGARVDVLFAKNRGRRPEVGDAVGELQEGAWR